MKSNFRLFALFLALSMPAIAGEIGNYPNAGPLTGIERMLSDQGGVSVDITPNQLQAYMFPGGVLPINLGGTGAGLASTAINNLLPPQAGNSGSCIQTNGTAASWQPCNSVTGGTPVALVGTSAITGVSANFMRADAAPAINTAMSPTMTQPWVFTPAGGIGVTINSAAGNTALLLNSQSSSQPSFESFYNNGTARAFIGTAGIAGDLINGSLPGDLTLRTQANGILFSVNGGTSSSMTLLNTGALSVASPSSGISITANAPNGNYGIRVNGSAVTNQSFGEVILAGTSSSDSALVVNNAANTITYLNLFGDGGLVLGNPTGGDLGLGSINMSSCFVNGVSCAGTPGPAAAGTLTGNTLSSGVIHSSLQDVGTLSSVTVTGLVNSGSVSSSTVTAGTLFVGGNPVYAGIPQNSQSGAYTLVASDANKHIYKPTGSSALTIPSNASVPFPIGTAITVVNDGTGSMSISISSDTMVFSPSGSTGSRVLAVFGEATLLKVTTTRWYVSGTGIT